MKLGSEVPWGWSHAKLSSLLSQVLDTGDQLGLQQPMLPKIPLGSLHFLEAWQLDSKREHCKRES